MDFSVTATLWAYLEITLGDASILLATEVPHLVDIGSAQGCEKERKREDMLFNRAIDHWPIARNSSRT